MRATEVVCGESPTGPHEYPLIFETDRQLDDPRLMLPHVGATFAARAPFHTGSVATFASGQPVALFGEGLDYSGRVKQPFIVHFNQSNR